MIISAAEKVKEPVDITQLYIKLMGEHRNVFIDQIEEQVFIYRALGRSEYRKITTNDLLDDTQKEEVICETCLLYPEGYDFEDCVAGIPTVLSQRITKNSYMDAKSAVNMLMMYRNEMWDLDQQATCLINEAFPQYDIEEVEAWDMEKTMKYLSRAEWKLKNLRGTEIDGEAFIKAAYGDVPKQQEQQQDQQEVKTEELQNNGGKKKERLTPEKLAELKAKYPEIQWDNDEITRVGDLFPDDTRSGPMREG